MQLEVGAREAEALADALLEFDAVWVDVSDAAAGTDAERPMFGEPGEALPTAWGENRLTALFALTADIEPALQAAAAQAGLAAAPAYRTHRVDEQDWVRLTQSQFAPIHIKERLWIVPSWHEPADPAAINILLDPGLAFGTGSHPTTRLCLEWLYDNLSPGCRVIDYGCGSGVLAIVAARLGAGEVTGVDIDPQAVETSRYNARKNSVQVSFVVADVSLPAPADILIANILSGPLRVLAPLLSQLVRPGGRLVLSGVLQGQADDVMQHYVGWFEMRAPVAREGWVRLEGLRRPAE